MSEREIEILRESFDAFERGGVEAMLSYIHPEFEAEIPTFTVCALRDGKIIGLELFVTLDEAVEAAERAS